MMCRQFKCRCFHYICHLALLNLRPRSRPVWSSECHSIKGNGLGCIRSRFITPYLLACHLTATCRILIKWLALRRTRSPSSRSLLWRASISLCWFYIVNRKIQFLLSNSYRLKMGTTRMRSIDNGTNIWNTNCLMYLPSLGKLYQLKMAYPCALFASPVQI